MDQGLPSVQESGALHGSSAEETTFLWSSPLSFSPTTFDLYSPVDQIGLVPYQDHGLHGTTVSPTDLTGQDPSVQDAFVHPMPFSRTSLIGPPVALSVPLGLSEDMTMGQSREDYCDAEGFLNGDVDHSALITGTAQAYGPSAVAACSAFTPDNLWAPNLAMTSYPGSTGLAAKDDSGLNHWMPGEANFMDPRTTNEDSSPPLSSYPMSRTGNSSMAFSTFSTDYATTSAYPSPEQPEWALESRRSSMAQKDPYYLDPVVSFVPESAGLVVSSSGVPLSPAMSSLSLDFPPNRYQVGQQTSSDSRTGTSHPPSHKVRQENGSPPVPQPSEPLPRRFSNDSESQSARNHPLYQVQPSSDGFYHCPNEGQDDCKHKPTPLKCNYDKYVDSHRRPYRCKMAMCADQQFSSTACLLRHEREAHAMHGHGAKPFVCIYPHCDRSTEGNGFPRRWNLFDHMKRVHEYVPPASPSHAGTSGKTAPSGTRNHRKEKSLGAGTHDGVRKVRSYRSGRSKSASSASGIEQAPQQQRAQQLLGLDMEREERRSTVRAYSHGSQSSKGFVGADQLEAQAHGLLQKAAQLRRLHSGHGQVSSGAPPEMDRDRSTPRMHLA